MKRIFLFTSLVIVLVFSSMRIPSAHNLFGSAAANGSTVVATHRDESPSTIGPSIVSISGHQLMVRKRNQDGSLAPQAPYGIRGVNWSPAQPLTTADLEDRRDEFQQAAPTDVPLIKNMNANTVRTYLDPPLDANGTAVLDQLYNNGLMVVMTVGNGNSIDLARVQQAVNFYKDHPAILMWSLGNEWNINPPVQICQMADLVQQGAALIKTLDPNHPVATSYGEIDIPGVPLADTQNFVNNKCPSVDVWSLNIFRGNTFGTLFDQWAQITTKPMMIGEFGTDAFRSFNPNNPPPGVEDGTLQSQWVLSEWNHLFKNLSVNNAAKVSLGGFVFEFNDEWWKAQFPMSVGHQDTNGCGPPNCANHPDSFSNEEYYGIVTIDRQPRPIYNTLVTAFHPAYQPQTLTYRAMSRGAKAAEFPSQNGVARFFKEGEMFYQRTGGAGGGRGFNVAVINPCTGELLQPPQNFDTWGSRTTGTAMNAMISFLNSLPNGTLILLAVGDEAGLNNFDSCTLLSFPWVQSGIQTLQALGSQQIDEYCYHDSWAMVTVKGEGVAREEQLGKPVMSVGTEASAKTTLPILTSLSPTSQIFTAGSGNGSVNLNVPSGCAWTASRGVTDTWITVANGSGTGSGIVNYSVSANTGDSLRAGTITIAGQTFVVTQAGTPITVQVTVQTNPSGRLFTVDGSTFTTAQTFNWTSGSCHTIATTSPQSGTAGTQYIWSNWSDSQAISHTVAPTSNTTFTANFTTQHFLTMNAGSGGTVSPPSGWFNSGQSVTISATPNSGCTFTGWTGTGTGSFSGSSNPATVTMNGPITETANFNCGPTPPTNWALASNGGVASASSTFNSGYPASAVNNGDRRGINWAAGGGWNDATQGIYPDSIQIDFNGTKSINRIDVFTIQDNFANPAEPTQAMTFSQHGITAFDVQYWNGSGWVTVPAGSVSGNNLVWRQFTFSAVTTTKVRVLVNNSLAGYSRVVEVEAWQSGLTPIVTTGAATAVTSNSATLNATVNPNGSATSCFFEWGTTTSYGNVTPMQSVGSGTTSLPFSANLTGLSTNTTYHFRIVASNSAGNSSGADATFTTTGGPTPPTNWALASNGGVASASSTFNSGYPASAVNNGDRRGINWAAGGGWNDATQGIYPDSIQIDFNGTKSINRIDVFTIQDNFANPAEPTQAMTFSQHGITAFDVQYWNGSGWVTVPAGSVSGNNLVWRQFTFSAVTTTKVRVLVNNSLAGYSRVVEVEAWSGSAGGENILQNPSFESGPTNWTQFSSGGFQIITNNAPMPARTGNWLAWLGGADSLTEYIYQDVTIPAGASQANVQLWYQITTGESGPTCFDFLKVEIRRPSDDVLLGTLLSLCNANSTSGWTSSIPLDVTSFQGQTIRLRFIITTDGSLSTSFFLDDISLTTVGGPPQVNVALATNGGVASASSTFNSGYPESAVNNGDRRGINWAAGGGWNDATQGIYPDSIQIDFNGTKSINRIDVFTIQDNFANPAEPTQAMTFSQHGITAFDVQYWNGSGWVTVPAGSVSGNNLVWRQFTFSAVTTTKVRVLVNNSLAGYSRVVEVEAWQ